MFVSTDDGETFATVPYPGAPEEVILAWAAADGRLAAGTNDGRVLAGSDDDWETAGRVPAGIRSLCVV
jgi:hypothetical protein